MKDTPTLNCSDDSARRSANALLDRNDQVTAAVTEVASGFKARIKAQRASLYRNVIADYEKKCQENPGRTSPWTFWPAKGNVFVYMCNQQTRGFISIFPEQRVTTFQ